MLQIRSIVIILMLMMLDLLVIPVCSGLAQCAGNRICLHGSDRNSALNHKEIIISENYGLIRFFKIDSFPLVLKPFNLIGEDVLHAGLYAITNEVLFDYYPGDDIQYHEFYHNMGGPPWNNYNNYKKYTILTQSVTADSSESCS